MKRHSLTLFLIATLAWSWRAWPAEPVTPNPTAGAPTNAASARIEFASTVYDFGKVVVGEVVRHDFIFTNAGDAPLDISGVYPKCGCTIAGAWSRHVDPGQTGVIPLEFNSSHFGGLSVTKEAVVMTSDRAHTAVTLQLRGSIWRPIEVTPQMAFLNIAADSPSNASTVVRIVSGLEQPITLSDPVSSNPAFTAELKTVRPGKEFALTVHALPTQAQGSFQSTITMKTSATNAPVVQVSALAVVQPAILVSPPQIGLPVGPLAAAFPCSVTIHNNSSVPLTLSDPVMNPTNVVVQLKEIQAGKHYVAAITFPAGFQLAQSAGAEFSVKTSNPKYPLIRVPVHQLLRNPPTPATRLNRSPASPGAMRANK
jgi:hypothetical protein